jgi:hypothetical protein
MRGAMRGVGVEALIGASKGTRPPTLLARLLAALRRFLWG